MQVCVRRSRCHVFRHKSSSREERGNGAGCLLSETNDIFGNVPLLNLIFPGLINHHQSAICLEAPSLSPSYHKLLSPSHPSFPVAFPQPPFQSHNAKLQLSPWQVINYE